MSTDLTRFDELKIRLSNRWEYVSIYKIKKQENLIMDGFKAYKIGLKKCGLKADVCIERLLKKIVNEVF